eukprot:CAMPEP_0118870192 /NCGR_PEP_ID=MMETSP1163-20130328/13215_1 /TAXON_ID=124430 /ORGANISM="Phaeomonas parva, Strain CCMP2877" /LENGTH=401 /DNA_ID=CAMNT_0006805155 /DNA_START=174 /DNA_END=1381 /DNA_ORIENTATION=-
MSDVTLIEVVDYMDVIDPDGSTHTEYCMQITVAGGFCWEVSRRYSAFRELYEALLPSVQALRDYRFPHKSLISTFADHTKVRRRTGFQELMDILGALDPVPLELLHFVKYHVHMMPQIPDVASSMVVADGGGAAASAAETAEAAEAAAATAQREGQQRASVTLTPMAAAEAAAASSGSHSHGVSKEPGQLLGALVVRFIAFSVFVMPVAFVAVGPDALRLPSAADLAGAASPAAFVNDTAGAGAGSGEVIAAVKDGSDATVVKLTEGELDAVVVDAEGDAAAAAAAATATATAEVEVAADGGLEGAAAANAAGAGAGSGEVSAAVKDGSDAAVVELTEGELDAVVVDAEEVKVEVEVAAEDEPEEAAAAAAAGEEDDFEEEDDDDVDAESAEPAAAGDEEL